MVKVIKVGDTIITSRFGAVVIRKVFDSLEEMTAEGYTNDSHYLDNDRAVFGKSLDTYHMVFAAAPRKKL